MNLVSNFIGEISSSQFGTSIGQSQNLDLNDQTFANLLDKQMNKPLVNENYFTNYLGMPAGLQIQNLDGTDFSERVLDQMDAIGEKINIENNNFGSVDYNTNEEITTSETVTFFASLLDNKQQDENSNSELFDFIKKQATNMYSKGAGSVITDLEEFVSDVLNT